LLQLAIFSFSLLILIIFGMCFYAAFVDNADDDDDDAKDSYWQKLTSNF